MSAGRRALLLLAIALTALPAFSQDRLSESDARAVRAVIEAQLDAFRNDDAERAFSYASDSIREAFQTPANFMEMVRRSYPVVYRPSRVAFEPALRLEGTVVQPVRFTDGEGHSWIAVYPMEHQADGAWRINGCQLGRLQGQET